MVKPLIINAPSSGIAQSPMKGFGDIRNIDIFSVPGVAKLNNILANASTTAVTATIKWIVRDPVNTTKCYAVDSSGDVYVGTLAAGAWTFADLATQPSDGGAGQGLAIWKDYLFCARATAVDLYGPLSGTPTWRNSWAGLTMTTDSLWHPMLVSKLDDKLYIGSGRYIDSVAEVSGQNFTWDGTGTYTATAKALTLPEDYRVKCLAEQGNYLMIGTWKGTNIDDNNVADIFPWDGTSVTYNNPIILNENGINAMINIGGYLYILAGIDGKIYKSNGVQAWPIAQIPLSVVNTSGGKYIEPYPGAIENFKGRLFFGISASTTDDLELRDGVGVYSLLETSKGNILNFEHSVSTESMGSTNPTVIGALLAVSRDKLLVGFRDNTTYQIDSINTASYLHTTAYTKAYFDSPLYQVGTHLIKRPFSELEFTLAKELAANEGIQIKFRINLTDSWTTIGTYTTINIGSGQTSFYTKTNIPACEQLQIRVELLGTATTTPEFKLLKLE